MVYNQNMRDEKEIIKIEVRHLDLHYGSFQALKDINISMRPREITALIGPSGCGKSTFLRCLNRMNDTIPGVRIAGDLRIDEENIYREDLDLSSLRQKVGMVFQRPNPFPQSIFDNVAFGPRVLNLVHRSEIEFLVEESLRSVALWEGVKDSLHKNALELSLGEQQRLCLARVLAVRAEIILMDEPCSALDPIATLRIEELMRELKEAYTIVIVTHNMQQAARVSDRTGLFWLGELVEFDLTDTLFTRPAQIRTEEYITGRMG